MAINIVMPTQGRTYTALRMVVLRSIDGYNISMSNGSPITTTPIVGSRLRCGTIITTYDKTSANIQIDNESNLTMPEQSQIQVTSTGTELSISLRSGYIAMYIGRQDEGNSIVCRAGTLGLIARGTMFTMGREATSEVVVITMLSGYADVYFAGKQEPITLPAGQTMRVDDTIRTPGQASAIITDVDLEAVSLFTLQTIYVNQEYLINKGGILAEVLLDVLETEGGLTALLEEREAEQAEIQEQQQAAQNEILEQSGLLDDATIAEPPWAESTPIDIPTPPTTSPAALNITW